jgi:hypothetical protein
MQLRAKIQRAFHAPILECPPIELQEPASALVGMSGRCVLRLIGARRAGFLEGVEMQTVVGALYFDRIRFARPVPIIAMPIHFR